MARCPRFFRSRKKCSLRSFVLLQLDSARRRLRKRMSTGGLANGDGSYCSEAAGAKYSKWAPRIARDSSGSPSPCIASSGNLPRLGIEAEPHATSSVEKSSSSAANFWSQGCLVENELEWVESMLKEDSTRTTLLMGSGAIDLNVSCGSEQGGVSDGLDLQGHISNSKVVPSTTEGRGIWMPMEICSTTKKSCRLTDGRSRQSTSAAASKMLDLNTEYAKSGFTTYCNENETEVQGTRDIVHTDGYSSAHNAITSVQSSNCQLEYVGIDIDLNVEQAYNDLPHIESGTTICLDATKLAHGGSLVVSGTQNVGWKRRNTTFEGPDYRDPLPGKPSALQQALMKFADRTSDYIINPAVGTEFDNCEEAFEYYNLYSWECGFGIRWGKKRWSERKRKRQSPETKPYQLAQDFYCSCRGHPEANVKTSSAKTNCRAMLRLHRTSDHGWIVVEHVADHNHPLSQCYGEKKQWPSHHHLDKFSKDLVRMLRENNIGITKLYSILGTFFGSMQNVPATKRCLKTVCHKINREQADDDIKKTLDLVRELRESDPGFMFSVDTDEDGRIKTLLWTNSRSRMQYEHFGDVVSFDTTFKTNLYDMPFGLFVGVNNHFQTVLLGGVLTTDEKVDTFKWVFKEFASLMGGHTPKVILTDQCRAMEVAIAEEWPDTVHRWCKWHVLKRVKECVGTKYTSNKEFRDKFHLMLNEMLTIEEFESSWAQLLKDYGLTNNAFLNQIYATRHKWVKSYFKGVFCARMTSTQRSESANMMLKNIVAPNCPLHQFIQQYMKMQYIRDEDENYEERRNKLNSKKVCTGGPLVLHAHNIYTLKVFGLFSQLKEESEFYRAMEVIPREEYIAEHYDLSRVQRWCKGRYKVQVTDGAQNYKCECGLFEHFGLPCSHILRVLITNGMQKIPDSLIMQRWSKSARHIVPQELSQYKKDNPALLSQTYMHSSLMLKALRFVEMGDSNAQSHTMAMKLLDDGIEALKEISKVKDGLGLSHDHVSSEQGVAEDPGVDNFPQRVPKKKCERGRPTNKRQKAGHEKLSKRPRFCSLCRSDKHTLKTCPQRDPRTKKPRQAATCSGCGVMGHSVDRCIGNHKQLVPTEIMFM